MIARHRVGKPPRRRRRGLDPELGSVLVEFALIVPILLIFLFGIITFGAVLALKSSMAQAAEEGARAAVGVPYSNTRGCPGSPPQPGCFSATGLAAVAKANSSVSWTGHACNGGNGMTCTATFNTCKDVERGSS